MEVTVTYDHEEDKYLNHVTQFSKLIENVVKSIVTGMTHGVCQTANLPSCMGDGSSELKQGSRLQLTHVCLFKSSANPRAKW